MISRLRKNTVVYAPPGPRGRPRVHEDHCSAIKPGRLRQFLSPHQLVADRDALLGQFPGPIVNQPNAPPAITADICGNEGVVEHAPEFSAVRVQLHGHRDSSGGMLSREGKYFF